MKHGTVHPVRAGVSYRPCSLRSCPGRAAALAAGSLPDHLHAADGTGSRGADHPDPHQLPADAERRAPAAGGSRGRGPAAGKAHTAAGAPRTS